MGLERGMNDDILQLIQKKRPNEKNHLRILQITEINSNERMIEIQLSENRASKYLKRTIT